MEKKPRKKPRIRAKILRKDFVIRVRPDLNKQGDWNGAVDVSIITDPDNKMDDEAYYQVLHLCKMMCAIVPLTEDDCDLRDDINDFIEKVVDKDYHDMVKRMKEKSKPKANIINVEDNVIHITIDSDTKGNA
tara:strand:+ start:139 stop:534 length:396 start_codon:yes stop_codon:yes gene_type:complete